MATTPETNPDSIPSGPSDAPDQISPPADPGRESVEDVPTEPDPSAAVHDGSPLDPPGIEDGVAGTGGVNKAQDDPAR